MNLRISVYFRCRGEQQLGLHLNGQLQHVVGTRNTRLQRPHRIELVVNRGCGAREMKDLIARNVLLVVDISAYELKVWEMQQVPGGWSGERSNDRSIRVYLSTSASPFSYRTFSWLPVKKLSRQMTLAPRASSASQRCDPTNPAPPVTSTRGRELMRGGRILQRV